MRKKEIKELFDLEYELNHKGKLVEKAVYNGDYLKFEHSMYPKKKVGTMLLADSILFAAAFVGSLLLNCDSSTFFLIGVPYVFLFLPICYMMLGAFSFLMSPEKMNRVEYTHSFERIYRSSWAVLWLDVYAVAADIIYLLANFSAIQAGRELFFVGINIFSLLLCVIQIKYIQTVRPTITIEPSK